MKPLLAILISIAALPVMTGSASAYGCHREPAFDRYGWHRHVGPGCERINVPPPREENRRHHHDDDDRPRCVKKCHYVGPFKQCETFCR